MALIVPALSAAARAQAPSRSDPRPDEAKVVEAVGARAKKAGLGEFAPGRTEHFVGVGDAPAGYQAEAMGLCEAISRDFLAHFRERGFKLDFPADRLTVVMLKDAASYQAFSGSGPDESDGGHYEPDTNLLVIFDFRPGQAKLNAKAKQINTLTLVHETVHLLCYNTGLLSRNADLPAAISEGLAIYAELWTKARGRAAFGAVHNLRLPALDLASAAGIPWIPVAKLLDEDRVFDDPKTRDLAYTEAWLLVRYLLRQPAWLPKFRAYLAGMPQPGGKLGRVGYAESVLGPLDKLDPEIHRYAKQMRARVR